MSEGGCVSAVSGDLRSGAPHTHYLSTMNDRTSVGGGQGTETEGIVDRVLKARAGMKGGRGRRESGAWGSRGEGDWISTRRGVGCGSGA